MMNWMISWKYSNLFTESGLPIKVVSETIGNEVKEQNGGFLGMLVATMGASLLQNVLSG